MCVGGEEILRRLFEPLGYAVQAVQHPLDEQFPEWGESEYFTVELTAELRLRELLTHLYVLVPVLDAQKHYWVDEDEVDKLLMRGEGWLAGHPDRELIVDRYVPSGDRCGMKRLAKLLEDEQTDPDRGAEAREAEEEAVEEPMRLNEQRLGAVLGDPEGDGRQAGARSRLRQRQAARRAAERAVLRADRRRRTSLTGRSNTRRRDFGSIGSHRHSASAYSCSRPL